MWVWPSARCPLGRFVLLLVSRAQKRVHALYGIVGCPLLRGCFTIGVYGATIWTWVSVIGARARARAVITEVSALQGCPLREVPL